MLTSALELGRRVISVTLTVACWSVPDGQVFGVFRNLLISWDVHTQQSLEFKQNAAEDKKTLRE